MRLINESAYDTQAIRKVINIAMRKTYGLSPNIPNRVKDMHVLVKHSRTASPRGTFDRSIPLRLIVRPPRLNGSEFIPLLRQQHGGAQKEEHLDDAPGRVLGALCYQMFCRIMRQPMPWHEALFRVAEFKVPVFLPLRITKSESVEKPVRDIVAERHARVLLLEKGWQRKLKLAQTKIKNLRIKRRYYEKKMATRTSNEEEH